MKKLFDGRRKKPYPTICKLHPHEDSWPYDAYVFYGSLESFVADHPRLRGKFKSGLAVCPSCMTIDNWDHCLLTESSEKYSNIEYRDFKLKKL